MTNRHLQTTGGLRAPVSLTLVHMIGCTIFSNSAVYLCGTHFTPQPLISRRQLVKVPPFPDQVMLSPNLRLRCHMLYWSLVLLVLHSRTLCVCVEGGGGDGDTAARAVCFGKLSGTSFICGPPFMPLDHKQALTPVVRLFVSSFRS
jgi:hypothetical protein